MGSPRTTLYLKTAIFLIREISYFVFIVAILFVDTKCIRVHYGQLEPPSGEKKPIILVSFKKKMVKNPNLFNKIP